MSRRNLKSKKKLKKIVANSDRIQTENEVEFDFEFEFRFKSNIEMVSALDEQEIVTIHDQIFVFDDT